MFAKDGKTASYDLVTKSLANLLRIVGGGLNAARATLHIFCVDTLVPVPAQKRASHFQDTINDRDDP
jgi:hypothetical protein